MYFRNTKYLLCYPVIVDLDAEAGEEVAQMIAKDRRLFVQTDIGDEKSVKNLFDQGNNFKVKQSHYLTLKN